MTDHINKKMAEEALNAYPDKKLVFGEGNTKSPLIMMIGEAPGGDEEKQGRPFVGKAGKNLNEFLDIVGLEREDIYISNVVKLRPINISPKTGKPVNRPPKKDEIQFFLPFLMEEIKAVSPSLIVTLGNVPLKAVSGENIVIGDHHGKVCEFSSLKVFPLYHPAAIIYNRSLKDTYFDDINKLKQLLEEGI
ncbi:MAG: uracil-DNA glycosylase [Firmicutes bacterium]|nr:uracil-DNA glycosylase [Bacillota bacterium]